jgi:hypothetical protein
LPRNNPFRGATLGSNSYLCGYKVEAKSSLLPATDLTGGPSPPMFGSKQWAASLAEPTFTFSHKPLE